MTYQNDFNDKNVLNNFSREILSIQNSTLIVLCGILRVTKAIFLDGFGAVAFFKPNLSMM